MGWKNNLLHNKYLRLRQITRSNTTLITMVYTKFVEAGRVCLVTNGNEKGKLVVIADVIDINRVLVDNPAHKVKRQSMQLDNLNLTDIKVSIPHGARSGALQKAYAAAEVDTKWGQTAWAKRLQAKKTRADLTDFQRFKVKVLKQRKARIIKKQKASK